MSGPDRLGPGDHLCYTFDDDERRLRSVAGHVRLGLADGYKIMYLTDSLLPAEVTAGLERLGVPVAAATRTGQLRVTSSWDSYLATGSFDAAAMVRSWHDEIHTAKAEGWPGLSLIGDMAWAARRVPGAEHLAWYEAQVNRVFADGYALGVCLYDRRLFTAAELHPILTAHPGTADAGDLAQRPLLRIRRTSEPYGLRLSGEADASNRQALDAVLAGLPEDMAGDGRTLTIDVSELSFADAGTAHLLTRAHSDAASGLRLVGCSPALTRLLGLVSADGPQGPR